MKIDADKYRETFFGEAAEHLAALEAALLRLDAGPHDPAAVDDAFRAAHSIKGGADAVGFPDLARFTHGLETRLAGHRGAGPVPQPALDLLLEATDALAGAVAAARAGAPPAGLDGLLARLTAGPAAEGDYRVGVRPHPDAFRAGLDPLRLVLEVAELGTVLKVDLDPAGLPPLADLDPERCYLSWVVHLRTARPAAELADVFAFAGDMIRATVDPVGEAPPAPDAAPPPRPAAPPSAERAGLIGDFCTEATDHLEAADGHLLVLDADPTDAAALNAVYRGFHTIKGMASMLGLDTVRTVAHEAENLLNLARDGRLLLRGPALDVAFASVDALKRHTGYAREWATTGRPPPADPAVPKLLADLRAACAAPAGEPAAPPPPPPPPAPAAVESAAPAPPAAPADPPPARRAVAEKETVRVDRERLDKLINTIGELVIAQAMAQEEFDHLTRRTGGHSRAMPELTKISRDLQELGLALRMVPLAGTFQKMARLVRDLSRKMAKPVELDLGGEETELDKTVVDQLGDPLMHMVRNALDHGLEPPEGRAAAGKPAAGRLSLRAYHQGGSVYLELGDDGRGLDRDRIVRKAVERGIVPDGQRLSDAEAYALIFEPGFSTAAAVTDVSGRGVGMDVVRRNVEALQGHILIRTEPGKGTTFTIRLPLTLAIMDGLMVGLGDDVYVFPLLAVVESFRPKRSNLRTVAGRGEVVTVRGETVPLLRLYHLLGRTGRVTDPCRGLVVLVEDEGRKHAVLVDDLLGQMQAVVKSLDANYRRVDGLAGATILGDGRVAMILDPHGLVKLHAAAGGRHAPPPRPRTNWP